LREVRWNDYVLNAQLFHVFNMGAAQEYGSALLGKPEAFLAL